MNLLCLNRFCWNNKIPNNNSGYVTEVMLQLLLINIFVTS